MYAGPKVHYMELLVLVMPRPPHDILRFEVPVSNPPEVQPLEGLAYVLNDELHFSLAVGATELG